MENLLDVAVDPSFALTSQVYLAYIAKRGGASRFEVARWKLEHSSLRKRVVLFTAEPATAFAPFTGGRLLFLPDSTLLVSVGDAQPAQSKAQDRRSNLGTVVRIARDGSVPADNPFAHAAPDIRRDVYTYGHRNVLGLALHPRTREAWAAENGPDGGDELNVLRPGSNYGWPLPAGTPDTQPPAHRWSSAIAPSGLTFYEGDRFPAWRGNLFVGSLAQKHLRRLEIAESRVTHEEMLLEELGHRIRDVRVGPRGDLYVLTDSVDGSVLRLEPAPAACQNRLASHSSRSTSERAAPRSPSSCTRR